MTVYVDDVRHTFGRMVMCHMWADTLDELHAMAAKCGLKREWFQEPPKASWCHYDVSLGVKARALYLGAELTDMFGPNDHEARRLGDDARRLRYAEARARRLDRMLAGD